MKSISAKIMIVACLALVLGIKALSLLGAGDIFFRQASPHRAADKYSHSALHTVNNGYRKYPLRVVDKSSLRQSAIFEDDKIHDCDFKKEIRAGLIRLFTSFAKFELSSRILTFYKSYTALLNATVHHSPRYVLDLALLI